MNDNDADDDEPHADQGWDIRGLFRAVCKSHLALPNGVENVFKMLIYSL